MTSSRFTKRVQLGFIYLMLGALIAMAQPWSFGVYKIAVVVMMLAGLAQVAVGNISPTATPRQFLTQFVILSAAIIGLFLLSIWLAPVLVNLGR